MSDFDEATLEALSSTLAKQLDAAAPPKLEDGSEARRQWLSDVMAVQGAFMDLGCDHFYRAMNPTEPQP